MDNITKTATFLKSLSDPTRLRIIEFLVSAGQPRCVGIISKHINVSQSATSQHLRILRQANLVKSDRRGYHIHYETNHEEIEKNMEQLQQILNL